MQSLKEFLQPLLPSFLFERYFLNLHLWELLVLLAAAVLGYFLSAILAEFAVFFTKRLFLSRIQGLDRKTLKNFFTPLRLLFLVAIIAIIVPFVIDERAHAAHSAVNTGLKVLAIFGFTWIAIRSVDIVIASYATRLVEQGRGNILPLMPLFRRAGIITILVLAGLFALQTVVGDVTTLVAGLGVFGVAIALASKNTLENLFGGLMLILDQPIRVGQECKFGSQQGIVEDIGLRTTRIRTYDRSVIAVPNGEFSQLQIENLSKRDRIRLQTGFGLRYETSPDQLRHVLVSVRQILYAHPKIDREPARVRFTNFGSQSLDIEIVAYVLTSVNAEFLAIKEDILLRIMDVVHKSGTSFAIPSQIMYQREHEFLSAERKAEAEASIAQMRAQNTLPMPEFSDEQISKLDDTIHYPPKGAANDDPTGRYRT